MADRTARWKSDTQFDFGSPTKTNVETVGSGDTAVLQLEADTDNTDNIPYTTAGNYTLSDDTKLEITGGLGKLKALVQGTNDWPMTTAGNYTYDGAAIEVTGGVAQLVGTPLVPYAWWHLNESSGSNVPDSSGNGYNGTCQNMEDGDWQSGKLNNCLVFGGTNEYVDCGNIAQWEKTQAFSVEFWIKYSSAALMPMVSNFTDAGAVTGWAIYSSSGKIYFQMRATSGADAMSVTTNNTFNDNSWKHVIITYDGSAAASGVTIYVNNSSEEFNINIDALSGSIISIEPTTIGRYYNAYAVASMDEVVIYDYELSVASIAARYNSGSGTENMDAYSTDDPDIYANIGYIFTVAVNTFTATVTTPAGTGIQYQISSDDGSTWKWWDGGSWTAITGGQTDSWYYTNESNTSSDVNTNITDLANSGTFKWRAFLHSDTGAATPEIDNIYIEEGTEYPTDDNLYIDTKDAIQIAPSTIFAWLTATFTDTMPANTDIKVLFSTDGRSTWKTWSGSAWAAPASATARANATSLTNASSNFSDLPLGDGTLDVRVFLYTSDNTATPNISDIEIDSDTGYLTSGSYESYAYQPPDNTNGVYIDSITYDITEPSGTSITIEARNVATTLETGYVEYDSGDDIELCGNIIQWKATFATTGEYTPSINYVEFIFHTLIGVMRSIDSTLEDVKKINKNRWEWDVDNAQWIIYDDDGTTALYTYDLKDSNGRSATKISGVFDRVPV